MSRHFIAGPHRDNMPTVGHWPQLDVHSLIKRVNIKVYLQVGVIVVERRCLAGFMHMYVRVCVCVLEGAFGGKRLATTVLLFPDTNCKERPKAH